MCDPADSLVIITLKRSAFKINLIEIIIFQQHLRATAGIAITKSIFNQPLSLTPFFRRACAGQI
jgi:hypothetical protein